MSNLTPRINNIESGNNLIINGAMDFWQRGTSNTSTSPLYLADRWNSEISFGSPVRQRSTDVPSNSKARYSFHAQGTPSGAGQRFYLDHRLESLDALSLIGETVTVSFKYKGTAPSLDLSTSVTYLQVRTPSAVDNWAGVSDTSVNSLSSLIFDGTWRTASFTVDLSTFTNTANGLGILFRMASSGATTEWNIYTTEWTITASSSEVPFKRAGKTISDELRMCQRYFQIIGNGTTGAMGSASKQTTNIWRFNMPLATELRATPSVAFQGSGYIIQGVSGVSGNQTAAPLVQSTNSGSILFERNVGVDTLGIGIYVASVGEGRFQLNAEL